MRSVSATCASTASAGWQHVKISAQTLVRNRAHASSSSSSGTSSASRASSACFDASRRSRRSRSIARLRAVVTIHAPGLAGTPSWATLRGDRERLLDGVLGEVEVAERADQDRDRAPELLPECRGDRVTRSQSSKTMTGRTSIEP